MFKCPVHSCYLDHAQTHLGLPPRQFTQKYKTLTSSNQTQNLASATRYPQAVSQGGANCQQRSRNSSRNVNILGDMVVRKKLSTEPSDVAQLWVTSAHVKPRRVRGASLYKLMLGTSLCNHLQFFWTRLASDKQPKNKCKQIFEEYNSASNWQISLLKHSGATTCNVVAMHCSYMQ